MSEGLRELFAEAIYNVCPIGVRGWADAPTETREDCYACSDAVLAAIEAAGFVVVPAKATREQIDAGGEALLGNFPMADTVYRAMLDARPKP